MWLMPMNGFPIEHLPDNVVNNKDTEEQYALLREIARKSVYGYSVVLPSERGENNEKTT